MSESRSRHFKPLDMLVQQGELALFEQLRRRARGLAPIVRIWHRAVPEPLVHHIQPVLFQNRILTVWAESPVWTHTLRHARPSIIARLHELGLTGIDEIESHLSPVDLPRRPLPGQPPVRDAPSAARPGPDPATGLSQLRKALEGAK
jgi:hypothetical protein